MNIRPIRDDAGHRAALARIEALWGTEPGTEAGDELDVLVDLVELYEARTYPPGDLDPVEAIRAHMELTGRKQADLARLFGSAPRASEILNRKRHLTVDMIHRLAKEWGMPAETLIAHYELAA